MINQNWEFTKEEAAIPLIPPNIPPTIAPLTEWFFTGDATCTWSGIRSGNSTIPYRRLKLLQLLKSRATKSIEIPHFEALDRVNLRSIKLLDTFGHWLGPICFSASPFNIRTTTEYCAKGLGSPNPTAPKTRPISAAATVSVKDGCGKVWVLEVDLTHNFTSTVSPTWHILETQGSLRIAQSSLAHSPLLFKTKANLPAKKKQTKSTSKNQMRPKLRPSQANCPLPLKILATPKDHMASDGIWELKLVVPHLATWDGRQQRKWHRSNIAQSFLVKYQVMAFVISVLDFEPRDDWDYLKDKRWEAKFFPSNMRMSAIFPSN